MCIDYCIDYAFKTFERYQDMEKCNILVSALKVSILRKKLNKKITNKMNSNVASSRMFE